MRIGEDGRKCVVFFGIAGEGPVDPITDVPDNILYGGTGFLVAHSENGLHVPFIVTCKHVAQFLSRHRRFYIRANTLGGENYTLPVGKMEWAFHPDPTVDVASVCFVLPAHTFDVIYYRLDASTTVLGEAAVKRVFCGEPVSLIGLFRLHPGKQRNISFVHTGNIAVLPDPAEPILIRDRVTEENIETTAYLIEAQTLDGLSGSPAFVHEMIDLPEITLEMNEKGTRFHPKAFGAVRLLGLYIGSWDAEPGRVLAADRDLRGNTRVPVGVGIVVPADRIIELLVEHPLMKKQRRDYANALKGGSFSTPASQDSAIPDPPIGDANPKHREDFNSLLGEAVQKREPKD
ncbi:MAG: hypothetical protein ACLPX7_06050 [Xanthobacteraceae bacterium]